MDRANNIFDQIDTDQSGGIDKGEITIHLLALCQEQETVISEFASGDVYEGEFQENLFRGRGKMTYANGNFYEGEWADDKKHGKGTFTYASGAVEVGCYEADAPVGQGVQWSADRTKAWELQDGEEVRGIPLDEAAKIAERIGLPPP